MKAIESSKPRRQSPSKLAPKLLCRAYEPSEYSKGPEGNHLRWKHSDEMKYVMKHMLEAGFQILSIEAPVNRGRIDVIARAPDGRTVGVEVKAHKGELREVDKIQAALYFSQQLDAVAVANSGRLLVLTQGYIQEVKTASNIVEEILEKQPGLACTSYTPHPDVCRLCRNQRCPYLQNPSFSIGEVERLDRLVG